jgi:hypothetical protein
MEQYPTAERYQFEIYDGYILKFVASTIDSSSCNSGQCTYQPDVTLDAKKYRWRVRAFADGDWAAYTAFIKFKILK